MKKETIDTSSLAHTKWNCKYHIVFAPKYRRKVFYEDKRIEIREILRQLCAWKGVEIIEGEVCADHIHILVQGILRGYRGENTKAIKEYIATQLKKDQESDQLSLFDPRDPFTGSK